MKLIIPALLAVAFITQLPAAAQAQSFCFSQDEYASMRDCTPQEEAQQRQKLLAEIQRLTNEAPATIQQLNSITPEN